MKYPPLTLTYTSNFITTPAGVKLHYHRLPNPTKPSLMLLHGMTDHGQCFPRLAAALQTDYDLIMPDARGHGLSDAPPSGYTPDFMAADVAALIEAIPLTQPIVLGHSMGAMAATSLAARFPQLVKAIILEDPGWWATYRPDTPAQQAREIKKWQKTIAKNKSQSIDTIARYCRRHSPTWDSSEWYPWAQSKQQVHENLTHVILEPPVIWREELPKVQCPALLITADPAAGAIVTPEVTAEFTRLCPHGQTAQITGAGHCIRREQFEAFMAVLQPFLATL